MPIVATAAWSIPKAVKDRFPAEGTALRRYVAVFKGVEINSTFYRQHRESTFARWAASVPDDFRFAVKLPREITHILRLKDIGTDFRTFLAQISPLAGKIGPLLCQLPPSLSFDAREIEAALASMREAYAGPIAIEVRHRSWALEPAMTLLERYSIDRVLADPAPVWDIADFPKPPGYVRLHGKPKMYYSHYREEEIQSFLELLAVDSWCVFDNTASGAACENALTMLELDRITGKPER